MQHTVFIKYYTRMPGGIGFPDTERLPNLAGRFTIYSLYPRNSAEKLLHPSYRDHRKQF
jgi:hypothetical protein